MGAPIALLLLLLSAVLGGELKVFRYCGHIEVLNPTDPTVPADTVGYVSARGVEHSPPKTCVWVVFEKKVKGYYLPTVVILSDSVDGYHTDVFSDSEFVYGHRKDKPVDFARKGMRDRIRELEVFLRSMADGEVISKAIEAYLAGMEDVEFRGFVEVVLPPSPATLPLTFSFESRHYIIPGRVLPRLAVRYFLYGFMVSGEVPRKVRKLIEEGKAKELGHTIPWDPIRVPADLVERLER